MSDYKYKPVETSLYKKTHVIEDKLILSLHSTGTHSDLF